MKMRSAGLTSRVRVGASHEAPPRAGVCAGSRYGVFERDASADPRIFQNDDLDPFQNPTALYVDENNINITNPAAVNGLTDMTVGGVISADPLYMAYPNDLHLQSGSPCAGSGTPTGEPPVDFEGDPRDPVAPAIGADEP
jgi:hypothetical protein